ncbi:MAG TPA: OmpA family protein [Candidatus Binatia bacterium]|jgi:outer membrane protein OmpA-like peptidoglycan-associated protein
MLSRFLVIGLTLTSLLGAKATFAAPDEYDDSQSNPFRIAAYLMHPVGWLAEWIVFRPFHFMVSATEPQEAFFGHRPHPPVLAEPQRLHDYGVAKKVPVPQANMESKEPPPPAPRETVRVVEVPVEKIVVKEVQKIVEVEKIIFPAVAFRFDSAELTELGKGQVYLAAQRLKEKADLTVVIEGHTDTVGNDDYNQKLGQRRAETVMSELSAQGIDRGRMSAASLGETRPLIDQDAQWARAVNRRVEFQVKGAR